MIHRGNPTHSTQMTNTKVLFTDGCYSKEIVKAINKALQ